MVTVFTPTYNRSYIIEKLYRSLQRQTCFDFEWLVVDDGSTDNTGELFKTWKNESNFFHIRYYRQENGGKHRAINKGVELAEGDFFFIVDSDDWLPNDSISRVVLWMNSLPDDAKKRFCGVCGQKVFPDGELMGGTFCGEWIDCTCLEREKHGITGDKAEVFFTGVMKKYPFPEIEGEKFITEATVWDQMAEDGYLMRFFNEPVYLGEYREDGLTNQGLNLFMRNPKGFALYLKQCRRYGKFSQGLQDYFDIHCYMACHRKMPYSEISERLGRSAYVLAVKFILYLFRQYASKIKQCCLRDKRRKQ